MTTIRPNGFAYTLRARARAGRVPAAINGSRFASLSFPSVCRRVCAGQERRRGEKKKKKNKNNAIKKRKKKSEKKNTRIP